MFLVLDHIMYNLSFIKCPVVGDKEW